MNLRKTHLTKALAATSALAMLLSLAACGGQPASNGDAAQNASTEAPQTSGAPAANGESTTLTVWCWDPNYNIPAIEMAAEKYMADHPDVTIVVEQTTGDEIYTNLTAAISGSQTDALPDVMLMHDRNIQKYVTLYPDTFVPLTDSGISFDDFSAYKVSAATVGDDIYAVPFDPGTGVYYLRTDILGECGYTLEDLTDITWEELKVIGEDVYSQTGKPMLVDRTDVGQILNYVVTSAGQWYFNEDGSANIADNPALKEFFPLYKELVDSHVLLQYSDGEGYNGSIPKEETLGMISAGWMSATIMQSTEQSGKWGYSNLPKLSIDGATNYGANGGCGWLVLNKEHQDIAKDFLASTLGSDAELYDEILKSTNAIATYGPARESESYNAEIEFFGGMHFYADILTFSEEVPQWTYGLYSSEATDAVMTALSDYMAGGDLDTALQTAQDTVEFLAG